MKKNKQLLKERPKPEKKDLVKVETSIVKNEEKKSLDEEVTKAWGDETPVHKAVTSLIEVKPSKKDELGSDIELKTDLNSDGICSDHAKANYFDHILNMTPEEFNERSIINPFVELKERKLVSLKRKSREEVVTVARSPDMNIQEGKEHRGLFKRWFSPQPKP